MDMNNLFEFLQSIDKDLINSCFESAGGFFALNHCRVLFEDKETRGVSLISAAFFASWGFWNLVYYTALTQPFSFYGAIFLSSANTVYLGMMVYYRRKATPSEIRAVAGYEFPHIVFTSMPCKGFTGLLNETKSTLAPEQAVLGEKS